ncbi:LamG-like jellyroll fold domain-containing protein [Xanthovirga aplysinae]|uniref:LamG-like jellyroll fold domain-containing protein n=1 Tax=Xanthovirga aplysinae TaxID=2529853 RepID=UPI001CA3C4A8|nr:LamG-like jellyroll fold domain-containing protein [Xanthovirga aplysinae]
MQKPIQMESYTKCLSRHDHRDRKERISGKQSPYLTGKTNPIKIPLSFVLVLLIKLIFTFSAVGQSQVTDYVDNCVPCNDNGPNGISDTYPCYGAGGVLYTEEMLEKKWYEILWPGTHNSYANDDDAVKAKQFKYDENYPELTTENQWSSIEKQLNHGVRSLTMDIATRDDYVKFCHGGCDFGKVKENVLKDISQFLEDNPHDVVIMHVDFVRGRNIFWTGNKNPGKNNYAHLFADLIHEMENYGLDKYVDPAKWEVVDVLEYESHPDFNSYYASADSRVTHKTQNGKQKWNVPTVDAVALAWQDAMDAGTIDWEANLGEMIAKGERFIFLPETLSDDFEPNVGWYRSDQERTYPDARGFNPEYLRIRDKDTRSAALYVNAEKKNYSAGDRDESRKVNDGVYLYNTALKAQELLDDLNIDRINEGKGPAYLMAYEMHFYDFEKDWRKDTDFSMVDASIWFNMGLTHPDEVINLLDGTNDNEGLAVNTPLLMRASGYEYFVVDGSNVVERETGEVGTQMVVSSFNPADQTFFLRKAYTRNYLYNNNGTIKVNSSDDDSYNQATAWEIEYLEGSGYAFKIPETSNYLHYNGSNLVVSTTKTYFQFSEDLSYARLAFEQNVNDSQGSISPTILTSGSYSPTYDYMPYWNGYALRLDGGAGVQLNMSNFKVENSDDAYTFDFWLKTDDQRDDKHKQIITAKNFTINLDKQGELNLTLGKGSGSSNRIHLTNYALNDDVWHHIIVSIKGNISNIDDSGENEIYPSPWVKAYVDGDNTYNSNSDWARYGSDERLTTDPAIGADKISGSDRNDFSYFIGNIDDLKIYQDDVAELLISETDQSSGPFAAYNFDGDLKDNSEAGFGHDITDSDALMVEGTVSGNYYLDFNGSQNTVIPFTNTMGDFPGAGMSFWINKSINEQQKETIVFSGDWELFQDTDGFLKINQLHNQNIQSFGVKINDGLWHHLHIAFDNSIEQAKLFVDSVQVGNSVTYDLSRMFQNGNTYIGEKYFDTGVGFKGYIDEIKFYNYALSEEEIAIEVTTSDYYDLINNGLVLDFPLDKDTYDASTYEIENNASDLVLQGTANTRFVEDGVLETTVLELDGDSYEVSDGFTYNSADFTNEMTVSFMFRKAPGTWTGTAEDLVGTNDWRILIKETHFEWVIKQGGWVILSSNDGGEDHNYADGAWHFVEASLAADGSMYLFVDGKLLGSKPAGTITNINKGYGAVTVGAQVGGASPYIGKMSHLMLTNQAITSADESAFEDSAISDEAGLIAYYDFEDDDTSYPIDVTGNHDGLGSINNVEFVDNHVKPGESNKALRFNGNGYVDLGFSMSPDDYNDEMTVSLWMRTDDWTNDYERVIDGDKWKLIRAGSGDNLRFYSWNSADKSTDGYTAVDDGLWHHVVMTVEKSDDYQCIKRLWIDGVKEDYAYISNPITSAVNNILLGRNVNGDTSDDFTGEIDELKIYSRVLSDDDIAGAYALEYPEGDLAFYKLDGNAKDDYGYFHGTNNSVSFPTDAERGTVAQFNGSNSISLDKLADYGEITASEGSFSAWFRTTQNSNNENEKAVLFYAGNGSANGYSGDNDLHVHINGDGTLRGQLNLKSGSVSFNVTTSSIVNDDEWHHVIFTWDESNGIELFLDGISQGTNNHINNTYDIHHIYLGRTGDASRSFKGYLDDVRIFDYALDVDETSVIYDDMFAYYKLDGDANDVSRNYDASGINGIDLNFNSTQRGIVAGFDGSDDYLELPELTLDMTKGFSFSGWVYWDGSSSQRWERLLDFGNGAGVDNIVLYRRLESNDLGFLVQDGTTKYEITITDYIESDKWIHVASTVDEHGNVVIYKNGVQFATGVFGGLPSAPVTLNQNYFGKSNWSADDYFKGYMDELKIFNRTLSLTEVEENYNSGLGENLAYYKFNGNADDEYGNFDGTAQNGADLLYTDTDRGTVAHFDGSDDYIDLPDMSFDLAKGFSVSGWFYHEGAGADYQGLFDFGNGVNTDNVMCFWQNNGNVNTTKIYIDGSEGTIGYYGLLDWNSWTHLTLTIDESGYVTMYKNGETVVPGGHQSASVLRTIPSGEIDRLQNHIGKNAWENYFDGLIDEVKVFNKALTQEEIDEIILESPNASMATVGMEMKTEEEPVIIEEVVIYPNPATDVLNISLPDGQFNLHFMDMYGKVLEIQEAISEHTQIQVKNMKPGLYLIRLSNQEIEKSYRVLIGN